MGRKKTKPNYKLINRPLKPGEFLVYRRLNGRASKYDRKRKLIVEVWDDSGRRGLKSKPDKFGNPVATRITAKQRSFLSIREAPKFRKQIKTPTGQLDFILVSRQPIIDQLRHERIADKLVEIAERKGMITASFVISIPKSGEQFERTPEIVVTDDPSDQSQDFLEEKICSMLLQIFWKYSKRMSAKKYAPKYRHKYEMVTKAFISTRIRA